MRNTKVAVKTCKEYDIDIIVNALNEGFDLLGGLKAFIKPEHTVLIKPDLYYGTEPNLAKTTNPNVVSALADLIYKIGAKCIIADSPKGDFTQSNLDNVYSKTQMLQVSNNGHATLNNNDKISVLNNPKGEHCRDIYIIDAINDADVIINVGKFRCDKTIGLVGCSQNLFGLIPGKMKDIIKTRCYTLNSYYNYNIDLYETLENKVILNILDGIVACETNNDPRILNTLLISENCYAIDDVALQIINQNPMECLLLNEAVRRNKFEFNNQILGDNIEPLVCTDFHYFVSSKNLKDRSDSKSVKAYNRTQKRPIISTKLCKGCKVCINSCPMNAITMKPSSLGEHAVVDYNKCISCFNCLHNCPYKIIETKTPLKYKKVDSKIRKSIKKDT